MAHESCPQTLYILIGGLELLTYEKIRDQYKTH